MSEAWKDIPSYEGFYQASNTGRIKSLDRQFFRYYKDTKRLCSYKSRILKQSKFGLGYLYVNLRCPGNNGIKSVHRLVASAFLGDHPSLQVNHKDFNKQNNRVENLEWVSSSENKIHNFLFNTPDNAKLNPNTVIQIRQMHECGVSTRELSEIAGIDPVNLRRVLQRKSWGYVK